jgi:hypothetical protein
VVEQAYYGSLCAMYSAVASREVFWHGGGALLPRGFAIVQSVFRPAHSQATFALDGKRRMAQEHFHRWPLWILR